MSENTLSTEKETIDFATVLNKILDEITNDKESIVAVDNILLEKYKYPRGTFNEYLANREKVNQLDEIELIILANVLHTVSQLNEINPTAYFEKKQITAANKFRKTTSEKITLPHTIEGVVAAPSGRDFVTVMSYREVADLWLSGIVTYNYQTQRLSKKKPKKDGSVSEKADVNLKSVANIVRLIREGKFKADTILLNCLVDGNDNVEYDNGELTIGEGTTVNLIDGMHRVQAIIRVLQDDPEFEGFINVAIKHFPLTEAQFLLGQINTVNRFDKTLIKHYMGETIGQQITKDLMNISELKNKVSVKTTLDKKINYYTNFAILSEAIETVFEPQNNKDRYDITEVLKKFFSYLIPSYINEFKNRNELMKTSWLVHHNTFVGFVVVAKKLYDKYGKDFPVDEIIRIINSINFKKEEGAAYNDILTSQGKVNSNKVKKSIKEFFEAEVDKLLS